MKRFDLLVKGGTAVVPAVGTMKCDIGIRDGKIAALSSDIPVFEASRTLDVHDKFVFPGAIDSHFHIGIYRPLAQDAASESRAAVTGGVTTLLSYFRTGSNYLNKTGPYSEILPELLEMSRNSFITDYSYHIAIMNREQLQETERMITEFGVATFKYYMFYKLLDLAGSSLKGTEYVMAQEPLDLGFLYMLMNKVAQAHDKYRKWGSIRLSVHCENPELLRVAGEEARRRGTADLEAYSQARPGVSEGLAINEVTFLANKTGCPINLLHLSSKDAIEEAVAVSRFYPGLDVKREVTLHHLGLTTDIGAGVLGKVNPPIRSKQDVDALWEAVAKGYIDTVASDHACITRNQKGDDLWTAQPGFGGTTLLLSLLLSEGYHQRGMTLSRIAELTSLNPATCHGLYPKKGSIVIGGDADLAIVDLDKEQKVSTEILNSAQDFTPFDGMMLKGWVVGTILRGEVVFEEGAVTGKAGYGEYIKRPVSLHGAR